jgi:hypothetical protein
MIEKQKDKTNLRVFEKMARSMLRTKARQIEAVSKKRLWNRTDFY